MNLDKELLQKFYETFAIPKDRKITENEFLLLIENLAKIADGFEVEIEDDYFTVSRINVDLFSNFSDMMLDFITKYAIDQVETIKDMYENNEALEDIISIKKHLKKYFLSVRKILKLENWQWNKMVDVYNYLDKLISEESEVQN